MSKPNITDSLNQLKDVLNNSNGIINTFKDSNKKFNTQLLTKIKEILDLLQSITNNPNLKNMRDMQGQLKLTQDQLATAQKELNSNNDNLKDSQNTINQLQQQQADLQNQLKTSKDDNTDLKKQLDDIQQNLANEQNNQSDIINNIAQVNSVLTTLVDSINDTVNSGNDYNKEYDDQITMISEKLKDVVNLLNGSNPPPNPPNNNSNNNNNLESSEYDIEQNNENNEYNANTFAERKNAWQNRINTSRGGKRRRSNKSIKKRRKSKSRSRKGGYVINDFIVNDNLPLTSAVASSSSTRKKRKHKIKSKSN
jgi:chromosome segregation ATPase